MPQVENEDSFRAALSKGINLFLGAGFSTLAKNSSGNVLPIGSQLRSELVELFRLGPDMEGLDLDKVCAVIERRDSIGLRNFLKQKFTVGEYDDRYHVLDRLALQTVFTTNIDDLLPKIFVGSTHHYLNDITVFGPRERDREAVTLVPLHGTITNDRNALTFSTSQIAASFHVDQDRWHTLTEYLQRFPTLFWGHSLSDQDVLQALSPIAINQRDHREKWIILRKEDHTNIAYFRAVGFSIIVGDTSDMLDYLNNLSVTETGLSAQPSVPTHQLFSGLFIPRPGEVPVRPLKDFYEGNAPVWYDIFSNRIHKTRHYLSIQNTLNSGQNAIVIGIPASGKTTLMMQVANDFDFDGHKLVCASLTPNEAKLIVRKLNGGHGIIFLDDFADSIDAFNILLSAPNVTAVGFDRDTNFETAVHKLDPRLYKLHDVTELNEEDIQAVYADMPQEIRASEYRTPDTLLGVVPSLFEVIESNTHKSLPRLKARYSSLLSELSRDNQVQHDTLVMIAYVHSCRSSVSFDVMQAFLRNEVSDYKAIFELVKHLGSLIAQPIAQIADADQNYFFPRSKIVTDAILTVVSATAFRRVLLQFHNEVSPYRIPEYNVFKRSAFDADYARRAFPALRDWREGLDFYEAAYRRDPDPYLRQQGALFLYHAKRYQEAFDWIDRAVRESNNRIFSIRNSQAIILFNANVELARRDSADERIRETLDGSMLILKECYRYDRRKTYHTLKFADQAIEYSKIYGDDRAREYLQIALEWLDEEKRRSSWRGRDIERLTAQVRKQSAIQN